MAPLIKVKTRHCWACGRFLSIKHKWFCGADCIDKWCNKQDEGPCSTYLKLNSAKPS